MSEPPRLIYTARPDATPETEAAALAAVYKLVIGTSNERKRATGSDDGNDDLREDKDAHASDLQMSDYR